MLGKKTSSLNILSDLQCNHCSANFSEKIHPTLHKQSYPENDSTTIKSEAASATMVKFKEDYFFDCIDDFEEDYFFDCADEETLSFSEDSTRCINNLINTLASYQENKLILLGAFNIGLGFPAQLLTTAYSCYQAAVKGKNIDIALFKAMVTISSYVLESNNQLSQLCYSLKEYIEDFFVETLPPWLTNEEYGQLINNTFLALGVLCIVSKYTTIQDLKKPKRWYLKTPAVLVDILSRIRFYWDCLGEISLAARPNFIDQQKKQKKIVRSVINELKELHLNQNDFHKELCKRTGCSVENIIVDKAEFEEERVPFTVPPIPSKAKKLVPEYILPLLVTVPPLVALPTQRNYLTFRNLKITAGIISIGSLIGYGIYYRLYSLFSTKPTDDKNIPESNHSLVLSNEHENFSESVIDNTIKLSLNQTEVVENPPINDVITDSSAIESRPAATGNNNTSKQKSLDGPEMFESDAKKQHSATTDAGDKQSSANSETENNALFPLNSNNITEKSVKPRIEIERIDKNENFTDTIPIQNQAIELLLKKEQETLTGNTIIDVINFMRDRQDGTIVLSRTMLESIGYFPGSESVILERSQKDIVYNWMLNNLLQKNPQDFIIELFTSEEYMNHRDSNNIDVHYHYSELKNYIYFKILEYCSKSKSLYPYNRHPEVIMEYITSNDVLGGYLPMFNNIYSEDTLEEMPWDDFGFLTAGFQYLRITQDANIHAKPSEVIELGKLLYLKIKDNTFPPETINFFTVPAMIKFFEKDQQGNYIDKYLNGNDLEKNHLKQMSFEYYFSEIDKKNGLSIDESELSKAIDSMLKLEKLITNFKSRPELAKLIVDSLKGKDCPNINVSNYLNGKTLCYKRSRTFGFSVSNKSIKPINEEYQNEVNEFLEDYLCVDSFFLKESLKNLGVDHYEFIENASVYQVDFTYKLTEEIISRHGIDGNKDIKLLYATNNSENRIYYIKKNDFSYELEPIGKELTVFFSDKTNRYNFYAAGPYKLPIEVKLALYYRKAVKGNNYGSGYAWISEYGNIKEFITTLKDRGVKIKDSSASITDMLKKTSEMNAKIFLKKLYDSGYEETNHEKFLSFIKGLIPFYNCIKDFKNGIRDPLSCNLDIILMGLPIFNSVGRAIKTLSNLWKILPLRLINNAFGKFIKNFTKEFSEVFMLLRANSVNKILFKKGIKKYEKLDDVILLNSIDDIVSKGVSQSGNNYLTTSFISLNNKSVKNFNDILSTNKNLILLKTLKETKIINKLPEEIDTAQYLSAYLPDSNNMILMRKINTKTDVDTYVEVNQYTGEDFGKQFYLTQDNKFKQVKYIFVTGEKPIENSNIIRLDSYDIFSEKLYYDKTGDRQFVYSSDDNAKNVEIIKNDEGEWQVKESNIFCSMLSKGKRGLGDSKLSCIPKPVNINLSGHNFVGKTRSEIFEKYPEIHNIMLYPYKQTEQAEILAEKIEKLFQFDKSIQQDVRGIGIWLNKSKTEYYFSKHFVIKHTLKTTGEIIIIDVTNGIIAPEYEWLSAFEKIVNNPNKNSGWFGKPSRFASENEPLLCYKDYVSLSSAIKEDFNLRLRIPFDIDDFIKINNPEWFKIEELNDSLEKFIDFNGGKIKLIGQEQIDILDDKIAYTDYYDGYMKRSYEQKKLDELIYSRKGLTFSDINEQLNSNWNLQEINVRSQPYLDQILYGSKISVTFKLVYQSGKDFVELPNLIWFENIQVNSVGPEGNWDIAFDMFEKKPKSKTFLPWQTKYEQMYHYVNSENKNPNGWMVQLKDFNGEEINPKKLKKTTSIEEQQQSVKNYLQKNGGIVELTIVDVPGMRSYELDESGVITSFKEHQRLLSFQIGFTGKPGLIRFKQAVIINNEKKIELVTTASEVNVACLPSNSQPPEKLKLD